MDTVTGNDHYPDFGQGLTTVWRNFNLSDAESAERLPYFVTVSSEFYPELQAWYDDEAEARLARLEAEWEADDEGRSDAMQ